MRSKEQRWQDRNLAAGLCITCGKSPVATKTRCLACNELRKQRRLARIALGRCHCGRDARPNRTTCVPCGLQKRDMERLRASW